MRLHGLLAHSARRGRARAYALPRARVDPVLVHPLLVLSVENRARERTGTKARRRDRGELGDQG